MFNISTKSDLMIYAIFPGQSIFIGVLHPQKALNDIELKGPKTFMITIAPSMSTRLPEKANCYTNGNDYESVLKDSLAYEKW